MKLGTSLKAASEERVLLRLGLPLGPSEGFDAVGGVFELLARQQFRNGEDLQAGIAAGKVLRLVETSGCGLSEHGFRRLAQGDERADGGLFAFEHALQVADVVHTHVTALHLPQTGLMGRLQTLKPIIEMTAFGAQLR